MTTTPLVSIVIPVHDDEDTVAAAIDSCLAQSLTNIEVICVDDASTDGTVEILREYAARDSRVSVIHQEQNQSAFQARRRGILAATGDYVLFVDGDDELLPTAAADSSAAAREADADLLGFGVEVINQDGRVVGGYQTRLKHKHVELSGAEVLAGLFPVGEAAQGQLWRYLFRTDVLREAYALLPEDLVLPRVNDLPLLYLVAALADRFVAIEDRLYRYHYGRGGSGQIVDNMEQARFYADAIRSIESIRPAIRALARTKADPGVLIDNYESVRMSIIGYVTKYLLDHTVPSLRDDMLDHLNTCASTTDLAVAAVRFYPTSLPALKAHSAPLDLKTKNVRNVLLTTRTLTTGGVSGVLLAQAHFLMEHGYGVTIVARRYGSDPNAVPEGATFIEMVASGLPDRLLEWADICRENAIDVIIDHQVLYSRDWPEYALVARGLGVANIGWLHNFAGRPIYDLNGLHELLKTNAPLLETLVSLSPLDVAFWKLRGVAHSAYIPNPPSPLVLESVGGSPAKNLADGRLNLVWWGRLDEHTKKVSQLIEVADELRRLGVDFHLTVIGPEWGDWSPRRFNELAQARRLDAFVEAVGERRGEALIAEIEAADAFISTSIIEGYQLTIAEAQIRGLPVFMYELPWLTIVQGNEGIVTAPQQDAAALAREIAAVAADPARYAELSRAAIDAVERELSHDFSTLYGQLVTGSLPAAYSPEPTLEDSAELLDLMIFFAEQHAGLREAAANAKRGGRKRRPSSSGSTARRRRRGSTSVVGAPGGSSFAARVWRKTTPIGRSLLRTFPGMRPIAHRLKRVIIMRQR